MNTEIIINKNITIKTCFEILNRTAKKTLIVKDKNNKLLGTLSNGDIRKALLKKKKLSSKIDSIYKQNCVKFYEDNIPSINKIKSFFLKSGLDLIPIVNKNNQIIKIIFPNSIMKLKKEKFQVKKFYAVIMAGGLGTRLQPFTHILPKPLIPINKKPIIEHIINRIKKFKPANIFITVNFKSKILKAFFDEFQPRLNIKLIFEKILQGTCGSLQRIQFKYNYPILLCNCDTYFNFDINKIINHHNSSKNDITVIVVKKNFNIPYGVCEYNKNYLLEKIIEKPSYNFLVNTGIYILNKKLIKNFPKRKKFDTPDLIKKAIIEKKKVGIYKINNNAWKDIGNWKSFLN